MKNLTCKLVLAVSLMTSGSVFAQNTVSSQCTIPAKEDYLLLTYSISTENSKLKEALLSQNCYDFKNFYRTNKILPGMFFAKNINDIEIFKQRGLQIDYFTNDDANLDFLSYLLIKPLFNTYMAESDKKAFSALSQKYLSNYKKPLSNNTFAPNSPKDILLYVTKEYNKLYSLPVNHDNENAMHFSILMNEDEVLKELLSSGSNRKMYLYKKNGYGIAPIHLAFAPRKMVNNFNQKNISQTNDILINNLEISKLNYLKINNISFFEFAEALQDNNPDLYKKLKAKFKFQVSPVIATQVKKEKANIEQHMEFINTIIMAYKN